MPLLVLWWSWRLCLHSTSTCLEDLLWRWTCTLVLLLREFWLSLSPSRSFLSFLGDPRVHSWRLGCSLLPLWPWWLQVPLILGLPWIPPMWVHPIECRYFIEKILCVRSTRFDFLVCFAYLMNFVKRCTPALVDLDVDQIPSDWEWWSSDCVSFHAWIDPTYLLDLFCSFGSICQISVCLGTVGLLATKPTIHMGKIRVFLMPSLMGASVPIIILGLGSMVLAFHVKPPFPRRITLSVRCLSLLFRLIWRQSLHFKLKMKMFFLLHWKLVKKQFSGQPSNRSWVLIKTFYSELVLMTSVSIIHLKSMRFMFGDFISSIRDRALLLLYLHTNIWCLVSQLGSYVFYGNESFAGFRLGVCEQLAQHLGAVLCLLDLPFCRSNIGCLGLPGPLSPTDKAKDRLSQWNVNRFPAHNRPGS